MYSLRSLENSIACVSAVCKFDTRPTISSLRRSPSFVSKLIAASLVRLLPNEEADNSESVEEEEEFVFKCSVALTVTSFTILSEVERR